MSEGRLVAQSEGQFRLEGVLDFNTIPGLLAQGDALFRSGQSVTVDMNGVTRSNSAGLGLLLEWLSRAQSGGGSIRFDGVPASLQNIAQLCNVSELLGSGAGR